MPEALQQTPAASEPDQAALEAEITDVLTGAFGTTEPLDSYSDAGTRGEADGNSSSAAQPSTEGAAVDAPSAAPETSPVGSEAPPAPAAPAPATDAPPAQQPPASQAPPAAATTPPPVDERVLREASLAAQVDALKRELDTLRANPQAQPGDQSGATPAPAAESGEPPLQRYNLTLPQPIRDAILSEDPEQNVVAITTLVNDLGTIVHNAVLKQVRTEFKTSLAEMARTAGTVETVERHQQTAEQARESYYEAFPEHKHPLVLPLIQAESAKLATEFPGLKWDENFRNTLGTRVQAAIDQLSGKTQAAPAADIPPQPVAPPSRPAPSLPSGTRGSAPGTEPDESELIMDTLGVFSG